jgi:hypothetical protein
MLCIMHEADQYGFLKVNGLPVTDAQLAMLLGVAETEVSGYLEELEKAGVFSRNRNGDIYSRRMTRDSKRKKDGEKASKTGQINGSRRNRQHTENKDKKSPPPGVVDKPPTHPEARDQKPERNNIVAGALISESESVREDAAAAFRMWNDLAKSVDHVPPCEAVTEIRQRKLHQVLSHIGGLEGWTRLLEKLGESEYFRARLVTGFKPGIDWVLSDANYPKILEGNYDQSFENRPKTPEIVVRREASQWIERMNGFRETGFWTSNWGPRPGEEGCEVPSEFLSTEAAE